MKHGSAVVTPPIPREPAGRAARTGLAEYLPDVTELPEAAWLQRHHKLVLLLLLHVPALGIVGLRQGFDPVHTVLEVATLLPFVLAAFWPFPGRRLRTVASSLGLITASALLVHFSGGYIEAHFHYFVTLGIIALYQDWLPYGLSVAYVGVHHGVMGALAPNAVFNHPAALEHPWTWALIHAGFILAMSFAVFANWRAASAAQAELEAQRALTARSERLAALGTLVAGVAHEINNPLTSIRTRLELAQLDLEDAERAPEPTRPIADASRFRRELDVALQGTHRIERVVKALRAMSQEGNPGDEAPDVNQVVEGVASLLRGNLPHPVRLNVVPSPEPLHVQAGDTALHRALLNLATNAVEAVDERGGTVTLEVRRQGREAEIRVQDDGPGIPQEHRERIFTPFYTTKKQGTGLGLSVSHALAERFGGSLHVDAAPERGALFTLRVPLATGGPPSRHEGSIHGPARPCAPDDPDAGPAQELRCP